MKKIIFLIYFFSSLAIIAFGQDLISNTRNGTAYQQAKSEPNTIAKLIEDRKRQKAIFQNVEMLEFDLSKQTREYENIVSDAIFLELNQIKLAKFLSSPARDIAFKIPVARGKNIILELTHVNVVSEGFSVITSSGKEAFHSPTGIFYQGIVKGDFNSLAAVSIFKNHIRILIADKGGNYVVGKLGSQNDDYILYNDKKLKIRNTFTCGTPDFPISKHQQDFTHEKRIQQDAGDCVEIYIESVVSGYKSKIVN